MELLLPVRIQILVLIRVESLIENTTNSNEFLSKDGTVVRIPDADFNIVPRSVTKNTTPCSTRIQTTTICVNNQGLIGYAIYYFKCQLSEAADMHYINGRVDCNGRAALRMNYEKFPDRRMPDHRIFQRLHRQLSEPRSFHVTRHDAG
ncbi:hypothetical protein TNCV_839601 [Trichonephila clavipes]|nr:hypothetical protein TNCV_839601 [Trichonephila clavipes]